MEPCPHCGATIDPQRHRYRLTLHELPSRLFGFHWPGERLDRAYTVRCPQCSNTYVSLTLRRFGVLTRGNYVSVMGVAMLCFIGLLLLGD